MMSNEEPTQSLRDEARFLLNSFEQTRGEVKNLLTEMEPLVEKELMPGTALLDTFLGPAQEACDRDADLLDLVGSELSVATEAEGVELAIGMLRSLFDGFVHVVVDLEKSVQPFVEDKSLLLDEKSALLELENSSEERITLLSLALDLQTQRALLESQRRATGELETRARQVTGQNAFKRTASLLGEELLQECWMKLVRGEAKVDELIDEEKMSEVQAEAFRELVLLTAARIDTDHLESVNEGIREEPREEESPLELKFCLKFSGPDPIARGEIGEYSLLIRNDHLETLHLDSLDLERSFSNGFRLRSIKPEPEMRRETEREVTFELNIDVAAGQAVEVLFRVEARIPGNWSGELTVWTARFASTTCVPNVDIIDVQ